MTLRVVLGSSAAEDGSEVRLVTAAAGCGGGLR